MSRKNIISIILILCMAVSCTSCANKGRGKEGGLIKPIAIKVESSKSIGDKTIQIDEEIRNIVGDDIDRMGLYYYDIKTGENIAINEDKVFRAASTTKVDLAMMVMDAMNRGELSPNDTFSYVEELDYEDGTGILQDLETIKPLTVMELIKLSIVYSDNIATNMLYRTTPYNRSDYIYKVTGIPCEKEINESTPKQQFLMLKRLYENNEKNPYYDKLIEFMKETEFHDRIDKDIPWEICAHKIGNNDIYIHDIGIIYTENPYILVVYTEDLGNEEYAMNVISDISKKIYEINQSN